LTGDDALRERLRAEQDERRRIAEALHDGPVQHVAALSQMLDAVVHALGEDDPVAAREIARRALQVTRDTAGELREIVRHRAKMVAIRSSCRAQVHAVLAKCGVQVVMSDLFGVAGTELLDRLRLPAAYTARITSLRRVIDALDFEIEVFTKLASGQLARDPGFTAVQTIPGIGPVLGAVLVAEIGDVHRFGTAQQLGCWAGMTPKHHESDTKVRRGRITKQGSRLVRWAAVESVQRLPKHAVLGAFRDQVAARRGTNIGVVAAARRQLEYVYYALRDHHVRGLQPRPTAPPAAAAS